MKRQIIFLILCYIALAACMIGVRLADKRPSAPAIPMPAPVFLWPAEVYCEAD